MKRADVFLLASPLLVVACSRTESYSVIERAISCCTEQGCYSPLIVDLDGNGLRFTSSEDGVVFDIDADNMPDQVAWTLAGEADAWLVIDRNDNGLIDDGAELFGQAYDSVTGQERNGFDALALLDTNGSGFIDAGDAEFLRLQLWEDANHNGHSEPSELRSLSTNGITSISLDYKSSSRTDRYGNELRFRAKVTSTETIGVYAYDVYLLRSDVTAKPRDIGSVELAVCTAWACECDCYCKWFREDPRPIDCHGQKKSATGGASTEAQARANCISKCAAKCAFSWGACDVEYDEPICESEL